MIYQQTIGRWFPILWIGILFLGCDPTDTNRLDSPYWYHQSLPIEDVKGGYFTSLKLDSQKFPHIVLHLEEEQIPAYWHKNVLQRIEPPIPSKGVMKGWFNSLVLTSTDEPHVVYYTYDKRYESALVNLAVSSGSGTQADQLAALQELLVQFSEGNALVYQNIKSGKKVNLDVASGNYANMSLINDQLAYVAYCSTLWDTCRDFSNLQNLLTGCGISIEELQTILFAQKCNPSFLKLDISTGFRIGPIKTIERRKDDNVFHDLGISLKMVALDSQRIILVYADITTFELRFARSDDGGDSWNIRTLDTKNERVGDHIGLAARDINGTTHIAVPYFAPLLTASLELLISRDNGANWESITIDDLNVRQTGWYPTPTFAPDGTLLIAYYQSSNPKSLQYAEISPTNQVYQEQANSQTSETLGRYISTVYDEQAKILYVSYHDRGNKGLVLSTRTRW